MKTPLLIKFLIGSEAVFFIALIMAFLYYRSFAGYEPGIDKLSPSTTGIYSLFLFSSSLTYHLTERSHRRGNMKMLKVWLASTILLGLVFMFGQGKEYYKLLSEGLSVDESVFGTNFYTLTGFHGLHVVIGLIALSICLTLAFAGDFKRRETPVLRSMGIYWHFVDVVWVFVFTVVYLIPIL